MTKKESKKIAGFENGLRVESRVLEEQIQHAVTEGYHHIEINAYGQHGIGGRLWRAGDKPVKVDVTGSSGQRVGAMGFANTIIEVFGPASDDVGWLNAGAQIIVHGNATNGVANAMAQGAGLVLAGQALEQKAPVRVLLCDAAGDIALANQDSGKAPVSLKPRNVTPHQMLQGLIKGGAKVEVCALYLPNTGKQPTDLLAGVMAAKPADVAAHLLKPGVKTLAF